jgi:hypothetical protein
MNQKNNQPDNQIEKALDQVRNAHDAEQYRLRQAEELLRRCGYVPMPNSNQWCFPENLPDSEE